MNIFINGFQRKFQHPIVYNILNEFEVNKCYFTYSLGRLDNRHIPSTTSIEYIYHIKYCLEGPDLNIDHRKKPIDEELLDNFKKCESNFLQMMDRNILKPKYQYYHERRRYYLRQLNYWNNFLDDNKIDIAIFANVPHELYDYIIFHLCKFKKIPTIVLYQPHIKETILYFNDFNNPFNELKIRYEDLLKDSKLESKSRIKLSQRFEYHFKKQTNKNIDPTPTYMFSLTEQMKRILSSFIDILSINSTEIEKNLLKIFKKLVILKKNKKWIKFFTPNDLFFENFRKELQEKRNIDNKRELIVFTYNKILVNLKELISKYLLRKIDRIVKKKKFIKEYNDLLNFYENLTVKPDFSKKYIYVPLQRQPERSTSPLAGEYVNQKLMIELISFLLPKNIYIYVKEHPKQTQICRDKEFYRDLFLLPNVHLISRVFDTYKLMENSIAIANCGGTAGWEAIFREKPVLLFGTIYYQFVKGVFKINSLEDCQKALNKILEKNFTPKLKDVKIFLKAIEDVSIKGNANPNYKMKSLTAEEKNIQNVSNAIIEKIKSKLYR